MHQLFIISPNGNENLLIGTFFYHSDAEQYAALKAVQFREQFYANKGILIKDENGNDIVEFRNECISDQTEIVIKDGCSSNLNRYSEALRNAEELYIANRKRIWG